MLLADIAPSPGPDAVIAPLLIIGVGLLVLIGVVVLIRMARSRRKD
ncbi:hypothetical protein [Kitasatospora cinereorecta]|uniref:LPXTG cell wall anchor domain-containing protein n=1 Tax=Kitasatospora cinereorecta TaxID=285560 RepID=A0ABW0V6G2_9ACTN